LKHLQISPQQKEIRESVDFIANNHKDDDGGINPAKTVSGSDVCINGMFLNYACYFGITEEKIRSIIDFLLGQQLKDGGFNCRSNRSGAVHSSLHTTISVLEGILEYSRGGYTYRKDELETAAEESREFILRHRLFRSDHTGEIIHKDFLKLSFPGRWKFDILRALDYFRNAGASRDHRMDDALRVLKKKRRADGTWPLQAKHPGQVHFEMEKPGQPSRWNTLRALRVLNRFTDDEEV
jgi:hypothetical protein